MHLLRRLRLAQRLALAFAFLLVLMGASNVIALARLAAANASNERMVSVEWESARAANELIGLVNENAQNILQLYLAADSAQVASLQAQIGATRGEITARYDRLDSLVTDSVALGLLAELKQRRQEWVDVRTRATDLLVKAGDRDAAVVLMNGDGLAAVRAYTGTAEALIAHVGGTLISRHEEGEAQYAEGRTLLLLLGLVAVVLGALSAWAIVRSVAAPVRALGAAADRMAEGDLEQVVETGARDEIGELARAFDRMVAAQRDVAAAARRAAAGDVSTPVVARGERDVLAHSFEALRGTMQALVADTGRLVDACAAGDLAHRADDRRFAGVYGELVARLNGAVAAVQAPLAEIAAALGRLADGDLGARVPEGFAGEYGRIARSFNDATRQLAAAVAQVAGASQEVAGASQQIDAGSQALAQDASEQATALEEVGASLHEISSMTRQSTLGAREAHRLAGDAAASARAGSESMQRLSDAVERIKQASDQTARILRTIDEIAFQTNLLALNAAVEAARAGDAGRGFAVVAEEVRALALRAAEASRSTAALVEEAVRTAEEGVTLNHDVAQGLGDIGERVGRLATVVAEISAASEQQAQGVEQIAATVEQMNGVTQRTAASAEETAASAEELSQQSRMMEELVARFRLDGDEEDEARAHDGRAHEDGDEHVVPAAIERRMTAGVPRGRRQPALA